MPKVKPNRDEAKEMFWRKTIARQLESRLTQAAFCEQERINQNNFSWWKREVSRRDAELSAGKAATFVQLTTGFEDKLPETSQIAIAEIDLTSHAVRIFRNIDRNALREILAALRELVL